MADPRADFLAAHNRSSRPDDSWIRALEAQQGAQGPSAAPAPTQPVQQPGGTATLGASAPVGAAVGPYQKPPGPVDVNVPFGTRVLDAAARFAKGAAHAVAAIGTEVSKAGGEAATRLKEDVTDSAKLGERANAIGPGLPGALPVMAQDVVEYLASPVKGVANAIMGIPIERATGGRIPKETAGEAVMAAAPMLSEMKGVKAVTGAARLTEEQVAAELPKAEAPIAEAPAIAQTEFTTAKGSTYVAHDDGTTTRNKAARADIGHEGQSGPQPRSQATFYVSKDQADALSLIQAQGAEDKGMVIAQREDGSWGVKYTAGEDAGKFERRTVVTPKTEPEVGLTPVEVFNDGKTVHFGNEITEVRAGASVEGVARAAASEAAAAPESAPARAEYTIAGKTPDALGRFRLTEADRAAAGDYLNGKIGDNPIQASLETLSNDAAASEIIVNVARQIPKGAVKPDDVLRMAAHTLQRTPEEILAGLKAAMPSDEEILAAKMVIDATAREVKVAVDAFVADSSDANFEEAARAITLLLGREKNWEEVGTEQGRALRARQVVSDLPTDEQVNAVRQIVKDAGPDGVEEAIRKTSALKDPKKITPFMAWLRRMKGRDALVYAFQTAYLSNPKSILRELSSDAITAAWNTAARGLAPMFGGVRQGEATQLAFGYMTSLTDGLRLAARAMSEGESQFMSEYQTIEGNLRSRAEQLAKTMAKQGETETPRSAATRFLGMFIPLRWQMAADDFNKYINYRAYLRAGAYRRAVDEGLAGDELGARMNDMMNNVPMDLHEEAHSAAITNSFQDTLTGMGAHLDNLMNAWNWSLGIPNFSLPVGKMIMPFIKVPWNIGKFAMRSSPLYALSEGFRMDMRAGGARRSLALAQVGLGSAVTGYIATQAAAGNITGYGPHQPALRGAWLRAGNQPYSFRMGGQWVSYMGFGPVAMIIGPTADTVDILRFSLQERDAEDAVWSAVFGVAQAITAPATMMGISNFMEALNDPEANAARYGEDFVAGLAVPQAVWGIERGTDPWRRMHYGTIEDIMSRTPGLSKTLPQAVDFWGDPVAWPGADPSDPSASLPLRVLEGVERGLSPIPRKSAEIKNPIDKWIWENRMVFPLAEEGRLGLSAPGQVQTFSSGGVSAQIELTPMQLHDWRVMAGQGAKMQPSNLGAKDYFNRLAEGTNPDKGIQDQWNKGSPELRAILIQRVWAGYRDLARAEMLKKDKGLLAQVEAALKARAGQLKAPAAAPAPRAQGTPPARTQAATGNGAQMPRF